MAWFTDTTKFGSGGFGEVWLCTRDKDGGEFAKKRLFDNVDSDGIARFQREVRLLARLNRDQHRAATPSHSAKMAQFPTAIDIPHKHV